VCLGSKRTWNGPAASRGRAQELTARWRELAVRGNVGGRTLARRAGGQPLAIGAATQGWRVARGSGGHRPLRRRRRVWDSEAAAPSGCRLEPSAQGGERARAIVMGWKMGRNGPPHREQTARAWPLRFSSFLRLLDTRKIILIWHRLYLLIFPFPLHFKRNIFEFLDTGCSIIDPASRVELSSFLSHFMENLL
jgi:hypothetical protein